MALVEKNADIQYGFFDRLSAIFPSQINVDLTEKCNLACVHCVHAAFRPSRHHDQYSLDPELNTKLVDEVSVFGKPSTLYIRYSSNGEPLLHAAVYDMLKYATFRSGVTVTLTTNGTLLDRKRIEMLLATNIHLIDVSIDAYTEETYAKIRIGGNLNVTRGNVCALLKEVRDAGLKTKIIVSFVEQPENVHEAQAFERFWEDHGVDYVVIRRLHSNAGAISEVADIMRRDNADEIRRPCLYPWERIVLNARGYLAFCPVDWTHRGAFANYRQVTIRDVWQGDFYRKLREAHLTNHYDDHQFCGQCPDWKSTRWPREGRCYADMVEEFREKK